MAITRLNNFDGGSQGITLTTLNTGGVSGDAFQTLTGAVTFDNTHVMHGSYAMLCTNAGSNASAQWTGMGSFGTCYFRTYVYYTGAPSGNARVFSWQTSTATVNGILYINASRQLLFADTGGSAITGMTSTTLLPLNQYFRVEGWIFGSATVGQVEFKIFLTPDSAVADETKTSTANVNTGGAGIDRQSNGPSSAVALTYWMDDVGASDTGYLGPSGGAPSTIIRPQARRRSRRNWHGSQAIFPAIVFNPNASVTATAISCSTSIPQPFVAGIVAQNNAEGGSNGVTVTTGNSGGTSGNAWNNMTIDAGATDTFDGTDSAHGSLSYHITTPVTASSCFNAWSASTLGSLTQFWFRQYLKFASTPTTITGVAQWLNTGGVNAAHYRVSAAGKLQVVVAGSTVFTSTTTVPSGSWFRIEGMVLADGTGAGQVELKIFLTPDSVTADETKTGTSLTFTAPIVNALRAGASLTNVANADYHYDDVIIRTDGYPGPVSSPDASVSATAISCTTSIPTPAISTGSLIAASAINCTISIPVPSIPVVINATAIACTTSIPTPSIPVVVKATAIACTVSIPSPSVPVVVTATSIACTVSIPVPSIPVVIKATAIACTTSIPIPSISAGSNASVAATAITCAVSIPTPSIPVVVTAVAIACAVSIPVPAINTSSNVAATVIACSTSIPAPAILTSSIVVANVIGCTTSIPVPVVSTVSPILPTAIACTVSIPAPVVAAGSGVSPTAIACTTSIPVPGIITSSIVSATAIPAQASFSAPVIPPFPQTLVCTTSIPTPIIAAGAGVNPTAISATTKIYGSVAGPINCTTFISSNVQKPISCTVSIPTPSISVVINATAIACAVSVPSPAVFAGGNAQVNAVAIPCAVSIPLPSVSVGSNIAAVAIACAVSMPSVAPKPGPAAISCAVSIPLPVIAAGSSLTATAIACAVSIPAPIASASSSISATAIPCTISIPAPTVSAVSAIVATAIICAVSIPTPGVITGSRITAIVIPPSTTIPAPTITISTALNPLRIACTTAINSPVLHLSSLIPVGFINCHASVPNGTVTIGVLVVFGYSHVIHGQGPTESLIHGTRADTKLEDVNESETNVLSGAGPRMTIDKGSGAHAT